ncbi:ubiquitin carboxyl-terminal hydrolase 31 isoform X2 [Nothobranchius furzeri]|uniref:ubiquitinyl hydrolase 1 n=1 Tax=Nothobranchius furzeri TaxID=105023 RepID=A0A9D2XLN6_NOTFU|nr:transcript variant X2 [Nothobranchius furzeri]
MSKVVSNKEKKSFSKKLFRRSSVRSVGSFMNRVLRTLSTLSHFGTDEQAAAAAADKAEATLVPNTTGGSVPSDDSDCGGFPFGDKVPGVAGLKNHGNTCFMNAILQCLSNTELFAEYLALEQFKGEETGSDNDKAKSNGVLVQKKAASQPQETGEVTEQLSGLVRALWTFEYTPQHSRDFKNVVSKSALQFRGNSQHDAQEFLLWLLDRVHEDLNQIVHPDSRPPRKLSALFGQPPVEEETAPEGSPLPAPGSFVQELFQAQYRSSLTCPHCQKQSNTFDPFLCISLPIPVPHTRPLYVTVVYQGKCSHCMRVGVAVPLSGTVSRLRRAVEQETKIPAQQIVLTEMYFDGFHRSFCDDDEDLEIIQESDSIFAFETPELFRPDQIRSKRGGSPHLNLNHNNLKYGTENNRISAQIQEPTTPPQSPNKNSGQAEKIVLLVCNRACAGQQGRRFGNPFILYLERTVTWDVLQTEILEKMKHLLRPGVGPFTLRVVGVVGITYLLPQEEQPLCHPSVERAFKSCGPGGPPHVKIVVEWDKETKDYLFKRTEDEYIPDAESVRQVKEQHLQPQNCTLAQCLQLYTKEEQLAPDDAWRCPHCKQLQQGSIKLSLWTLPDILILHLKRFRQDGDRRMKMQNMVKFPLNGMDMAPHIVKRSQSSWSLPSHWSPWRRPYGLGRDPEDYLYDLYAVCNHHGTMQGGHYTAHCKNSIDGQWYCFDDSDVHPISEDDVCKLTAYILFYQRRATIPSWSANSSVGGSTSSSLNEHWISRLMGSRPPSQASSGSSRRTSLASLSESAEFAGERSEDDGLSTRPAVRGMQRQTFSLRSSIASPLALSENGSKPTWPHSAKLQLRSNSPSRFSLESHSSPTLERIGEVADSPLTDPCFTGSPKPDKVSGGKSALAALDSNVSSRRLIEQGCFKTVVQTERRSSIQTGENNATAAEQISPRHSLSPKDPKQRNGTADSVGVKRTSNKTVLEGERSPKKRPATSSTSSSSLSPASPAIEKSPSRPQSKGSTVASTSNPRDRSSGPPKTSKGGSSRTATSSKKVLPQTPELLHPDSQQKKNGSPGLQSSHPQRKSSPRGGAEKTSATERTRAADRSASRETSRAKSTSDRKVSHGGPPSRSGGASRAEARSGRALEDRAAGRTSSSSSSMTSLRSSGVGLSSASAASASKEARGNSKMEDKGLSFFKSALRPKENRKPGESGKTGMGETKECPEDGVGDTTREATTGGVNKKPQNAALEAQNNVTTAKDKESSKASAAAKHSLLSSTKSKLSEAQTITQSAANTKDPSKKEPAKKTLQSRKIPINSTQTSQRSK